MNRHHPDSAATRAEIMREVGDHVVLAFSAGKDSIAAWLALRADGFRVTPVYKYLVPGLSFVERSLTYYEERFGVPIQRVAHPTLYRWLKNSTFMPPERVSWVDALELRVPSHEETCALGAARAGEDPDSWIATGVRAADSPMRRVAVSKYGSITPKIRSFWPVWDWNKVRVMDSIRGARLKLPIDYAIWGRSFDGIDARFLVPLKKHFPDDYKRVLEWFPLAELEVKRHEFAAAR